jgi:hypothetical protein
VNDNVVAFRPLDTGPLEPELVHTLEFEDGTRVVIDKSLDGWFFFEDHEGIDVVGLNPEEAKQLRDWLNKVLS